MVPQPHLLRSHLLTLEGFPGTPGVPKSTQSWGIGSEPGCRLKPWLYYLLSEGPWTRGVTSLCLRFPVCKLGIATPPTSVAVSTALFPHVEHLGHLLVIRARKGRLWHS